MSAVCPHSVYLKNHQKKSTKAPPELDQSSCLWVGSATETWPVWSASVPPLWNRPCERKADVARGPNGPPADDRPRFHRRKERWPAIGYGMPRYGWEAEQKIQNHTHTRAITADFLRTHACAARMRLKRRPKPEETETAWAVIFLVVSVVKFENRWMLYFQYTCIKKKRSFSFLSTISWASCCHSHTRFRIESHILVPQPLMDGAHAAIQ